MAALVHIDWAETEAENVKLTGLARTLAIALTINHLFIVIALLDHFKTRLHASTFMINHAIWANWCAHIALSDYKARWALWEPLFLTLLTILAFLTLSISTPEGKWLFAAFILLLEELGASEIVQICRRLDLLVGQRKLLLLSSPLSSALTLAWLLLLL